MDHQDHVVMMLNISIMADKWNSDRLVEEHRTPMEMFLEVSGQKQIERSWMGKKQREKNP
jgi:hypothetical protein